MTLLNAKSKKAQASVEMLATVGMVLAFTLPIIFFFLTASQYKLDILSELQAQAVVTTLGDAINKVYTEGPGSFKTILINIPPSTQKLEIKNKQIILTLDNGEGITYPLFADAGGAVDVENHPITLIDPDNKRSGLVSYTMICREESYTPHMGKLPTPKVYVFVEERT